VVWLLPTRSKSYHAWFTRCTGSDPCLEVDLMKGFILGSILDVENPSILIKLIVPVLVGCGNPFP
jgi:hypothetical protein